MNIWGGPGTRSEGVDGGGGPEGGIFDWFWRFGEKFQVEERENSKSLGLRQSVPGSLVGVKDTDS